MPNIPGIPSVTASGSARTAFRMQPTAAARQSLPRFSARLQIAPLISSANATQTTLVWREAMLVNVRRQSAHPSVASATKKGKASGKDGRLPSFPDAFSPNLIFSAVGMLFPVLCSLGENHTWVRKAFRPECLRLCTESAWSQSWRRFRQNRGLRQKK